MRRRIFLVAPLFVVPSVADIRQDLNDLFGSMAAALSDGNAALFLRAIDPSLADYERFAENVRALAAQGKLSSSIEITSQEGSGESQSAELEWVLDMGGVRRQAIVKCRLERKRKQWRIVAIEPASFFAP